VEGGERANRALMGVGIAAIVVGGAMGIIGGPMELIYGDRHDGRGAAIALMVLGGAGVVLGIPLTAIGARRKQTEPALESQIEVLVAPTGAGLRVSF